MQILHVCFVLRYLLVRAALAIMAFCSSSRPAELADVTFSQVTRDELDRGVWFKKIHAKNKKGTTILWIILIFFVILTFFFHFIYRGTENAKFFYSVQPIRHLLCVNHPSLR